MSDDHHERIALTESQECKWKPDKHEVFTTSCDQADILLMEGTAAKFCFNCGKKIRFVESENESNV